MSPPSCPDCLSEYKASPPCANVTVIDTSSSPVADDMLAPTATNRRSPFASGVSAYSSVRASAEFPSTWTTFPTFQPSPFGTYSMIEYFAIPSKVSFTE